MPDEPQYAHQGKLEQVEADMQIGFGNLDKDVALVNERVDEIEKRLGLRDPAAGVHVVGEPLAPQVVVLEHRHVAAGHGPESPELVTGPVAMELPAKVPPPAAPTTARQDDW